MKKIMLYMVLMCAAVIEAMAVGAYPHPIKVTQPDGSVITIQLHGDEYLSWMTCDNRLVSRGRDGFFYMASFAADGSIVPSKSRVSAGPSMVSSSVSFKVVPPASAVANAMRMREQNEQRTSAEVNKAVSWQGTKKFLVLLIEFSDTVFTIENPKASFENLLNKQNYNETGSVKDYFKDNSRGVFEPQFDVER